VRPQLFAARFSDRVERKQIKGRRVRMIEVRIPPRCRHRRTRIVGFQVGCRIPVTPSSDASCPIFQCAGEWETERTWACV
jgi:hypothetical protein